MADSTSTLQRPNVSTRSPAFEADEKLRAMPLALAGGLAALKEDAKKTGKQLYAWPGPGELAIERTNPKSQTIYDTKIDAARLDNVWLESLSAAGSAPFVNEPTLEGWPPSIQPVEGESGFVDAVDDQGRSLHSFWADAFYWKMVAGIHYIVIDLPPDLGFDAYWTSFPASNVLDVATTVQDGRARATEARLFWPRTKTVIPPNDDPDNWRRPESAQVVRVYRVSELVTGNAGGPAYFRDAILKTSGDTVRWEWDSDDWSPIEAKGGNVLSDLPIVPLYGKRVAPFRGRPPFRDTASLQMALWRKTLDYDARERRDARNLLTITGAKQGQGSFDGNAYWLPDGASAKLHETTGAALEALRESQQALKADIRAGNLRPIISDPQVSKTATEIAVSRLTADSWLEMSVLMDLASLSVALRMTAALNGEDGSGGTIDLPHDFSLNKSEAMDKLWAGYIESKGLLVPPGLAWSEAARNQWISETETPEDIAAEVDARLGTAAGRSDEA
jgi:hypothetical protein